MEKREMKRGGGGVLSCRPMPLDQMRFHVGQTSAKTVPKRIKEYLLRGIDSLRICFTRYYNSEIKIKLEQ